MVGLAGAVGCLFRELLGWVARLVGHVGWWVIGWLLAGCVVELGDWCISPGRSLMVSGQAVG